MRRWPRRGSSTVWPRAGRAAAVAALLGAAWAASAAAAPSPVAAPAALAQEPGGVTITEVRAQAGRGQQEAAFEWVEIHNAGATPIDLTGWRLADNRAGDPIPATTLAPGAYLIVGGGEELAAELPAGVALAVVEDGRIGNGLANGGDRVSLIDPAGATVDGVSWGSDDTITTLAPPPSGETLSRGAGGWTAAPPTPGAPHGAEPAQPPAAATPEPEPADSPAGEPRSPSPLHITEVLANAGEGSRDAAFEWVEVHNAGAEPIDLAGWTIADNVDVDALPGGVVAPGGYVTIGGSAEAAGGAVDLVLEDGRIGNGLANTGDVVTLRDPDGRLADAVAYGEGSIPLPEAGRSIERRGGGWALSAAPSPGSGDVTFLEPPAEDAPESAQQPAGEEESAPQDEQPAPSDPLPPLRITEVFASAGEGSRDAAFEWVEVHNAGSEPINLAGWTIADNVDVDVLPDGVVAAGAYVTIGGSAEAAGGAVDVVLEDGRIGNGLANTGDVVTLRDPQGRLADEIVYGTESVPLPEVGRSIALRGDGWVLNAAPSPGSGDVTLPEPPAEDAPESAQQPAGEEESAPQDEQPAPSDPLPPLRITEIFASAGEGSRDAAFEWVEVHNAGAEPIDLIGWAIADNVDVDVLPGGVVAAGAYVTIGGSLEAAGGAVDIVLEDGRIGNGLANGGDAVILRDPRGRVADEVAYGAGSVPPPEVGRSIALSDEGWLLNAEPSPGSGDVTPLLESLEEAPEPSGGVADNDDEAQDEGGIPAWLLVVVAVAVPLAALAGRTALRRLRRFHGGGRR